MQFTNIVTASILATLAVAAPAPAPLAAPEANAEPVQLETRAQALIDVWKNSHASSNPNKSFCI
tara:strand:- start:1088 stop:1279 length:192 start_codon:yes stop_codon:yes gene_type:complete